MLTENIKNINELDNFLSNPSDELIEYMSGLNGDLMILGVAGKMGPSLSCLAKRALSANNMNNRVIGVSRFSSKETMHELNNAGIETIQGDLLDDGFVDSLPDCENVIYMAGMKFGSSGNPGLTWAMNTYLPSQVVKKYQNSRIVALSTGNVYPFSQVNSGGCSESDQPGPVGEYAQSCLGRERIFEYFSGIYNTPVCLVRLNYAVEMRYGVLVDIASQVFHGESVDVTMGYTNVIWQGDANSMILQALSYCNVPAVPLNITGPEIISIRWLAEQFGERFGVTPRIVNKEADTALLNNAGLSFSLMGYPKVSLNRIIDWTAEWIKSGKPLLDKPTHFQERAGKF